MPSHFERVERTLDAYDPTKRGTIIGGAAIIWSLARRGADAGLLTLRDVDVVGSPADVDALHNDLQSPYKENATYKGGRLAIRPSRFTEYHSHLVPFEAFSYEDDYAKPSDDQEPAWPVMVEQLVHSEHTDMYRGRRHLKLGQTLWWKMHIGRPTDVEAVQQTLKIIHDQRLAGNSEFREILATIQEEDPFDVLRID